MPVKQLIKEQENVQRKVLTNEKTFRNYSHAMTWFGLNLFCRSDAIRETDGNAMIKH